MVAVLMLYFYEETPWPTKFTKESLLTLLVDVSLTIIEGVKAVEKQALLGELPKRSHCIHKLEAEKKKE